MTASDVTAVVDLTPASKVDWTEDSVAVEAIVDSEFVNLLVEEVDSMAGERVDSVVVEVDSVVGKEVDSVV